MPELILTWLSDGYRVGWVHDANDLLGGDLCFYLGYGRIVNQTTRSLYLQNCVVHASNLPQGRGWSPMSWLILAGATRIPVTLFEAVNEVDAGSIYLQEWIELKGNEFISDWRRLHFDSTRRLCQAFVAKYPAILEQRYQQDGEPTFYPRRRPQDSKLDPNKSVTEQWNLLRIIDNENYPAFFEVADKRIILRIESEQKQQGL